MGRWGNLEMVGMPSSWLGGKNTKIEALGVGFSKHMGSCMVASGR